MEFWKLYSLVKARRWMILGLLLVTLLVVFIAKKVVDDNTQFVAVATVLPDYQALSSQGFYSDNVHGLQAATYSRFDRMGQFAQSIEGSAVVSAFDLANKPSVVQKQAVVRALDNQITTERYALVHGLTIADPIRTPDLEKKLDAVLTYFRVPTDDSFWQPRPDISDAVKQQMRATLKAAPVVDDEINTTPGGTTPTPVITDDLLIPVHAPNQDLAVQIANLTAAAFINDYYDTGKQESANSISGAQDKEKKAKAKLNSIRDAIVNFKRSNPLVDVSSSVAVGVNNLASLQNSLRQAEIQFQAAQTSAAKYKQLAQTAGPSRTVNLAPLARPQVKNLQTQVAELQQALDALRAQYTDLNPRVIKATAALRATQKELNFLLSQPYQDATPNSEYTLLLQQADSASAEAARAQVTIATLNAQIAQVQAQNKKLPEQQKQLQTLLEDQDTAAQELKGSDDAVQQLMRSNALIQQGDIKLVSPAAMAQADASGPSLAALLLYGAILSLIVGVAAAIGLDYLDTSVQNIPDAERLLGMPVSAVIPAMLAGDPRHMTRLVVSDPLSPIAESYRLLRTDLLFTAEQQPFQSLMAATAKPGQGATTTICNLAVALASVGKRVILIDADLRRPKLHDFFGVSNETGLTSLLREECELEEALKVTNIDNLLVLPSGPLPLNPAELLASQKMRALHERLKPHTDFVLVDTPSAVAFSDASILASYLDAVMIVVRAQETPRGSEMQLKNLLNKARANVIGVVLNGVKPQLVDSYVYHAAYYPQITTGSSHALPSPDYGGNGSSHGNGAASSGDAPSHQSAGAAVEDIESTVVMDDIVTVTPPPAKGRFSLRKMFGTDDH